MSKPQVNGITGATGVSSTLDHFIAYPLISDLISYYKSYPLGQRSVEISQNLYNAFGKPVVTSPIVQNPYSYVHPYAKKLDEFGDSTLTEIDTKFPAVKETDLAQAKSYAASAAGYPFKLVGDTKVYVLSTYDDEYKKTGGQGIVNAGRAVVHTELRIASEAMHAVADFLGPKRDEAVAQFEKLKAEGRQHYGQTKKKAEAKKDEVAAQANAN